MESQPKDSINRGQRLNQIPKLFDGPYITAGWSAVQYLSAQHGDTNHSLGGMWRKVQRDRREAAGSLTSVSLTEGGTMLS